MKYRPKCFLSYAHLDKKLIKEEILPVLKELEIDYWLDEEQISFGESIIDSLMKGISETDFIISIFNRNSQWINFELGAAIGQNKPIISIYRDSLNIPSYLLYIRHIQYRNNSIDFRNNLRNAIEILTENVIDKTIFELNKGKKIIGVRVGFDKIDFEEELRFTADFVSLIKEVSQADKVDLVETGKGSFKSFFSIDGKAWAELLEKIIFFIPEWKKKKAENLKIVSEVKQIEANTKRVESEISISEQKLKMEQAEKMVNLLLKYKEIGVKFQIDDDILLSVNPSGILEIKEPREIGNNSTGPPQTSLQ